MSLLAAAPSAPATRSVPGVRVEVRHLMGMPVSLRLRGEHLHAAAVDEAVRGCFEALHLADDLFTTWRDSPVMAIRRGGLRIPAAHPWIREVWGLCDEAEEATGGLFTAWLPPRGTSEGLLWEPTGLVKGWAVGRAVESFAALRGVAWCLNAGGDIAVGGRSSLPGEAFRPWHLGIEDPGERGRVARVVHRLDGALATSGNAARGAHLWHPGLRSYVDRPGSVSVVGPSISWADVWATALFVAEPGAPRAAALRRLSAWGHARDEEYSVIELP